MNLPLTGKACIHMIITDLGVFDRPNGQNRFHPRELAPGVTLDVVKAKIEANIVYE